MPGGDKTGPMRRGPMSGRAMGNCTQQGEKKSSSEVEQGFGRGCFNKKQGFNGGEQRRFNQNFSKGLRRRRGCFQKNEQGNLNDTP